jgi:hypothetical protein
MPKKKTRSRATKKIKKMTTPAPPVAPMRAIPVSLSSSSHPAQTGWNTNGSVFLTWTFPVADDNVKGVYYVLDHQGDTVPGSRAKFIPAKQKQLVKNKVPRGIWVFHVSWADKDGRRNPAVAHYQVRIGTDPGAGNIVGTVFDEANYPIADATLMINRGLFPGGWTDSAGKFGLSNIPSGKWTVSTEAPRFRPTNILATVTSGATTPLNVTLRPSRNKH